MRTRREILADIINLNGDLNFLISEISAFEWDCEAPLVEVDKIKVADLLRKYLEDNITKETVALWADLIELREDIKKESLVTELIQELANPILFGDLTKNKAKKIISQLEK